MQGPSLYFHFTDDEFQEFNKFRILVVYAEVETVEQTYGVLLDIVVVVANYVNYFLIELIALIRLPFGQSVCLFEPVDDLVVEIDLLSVSDDGVVLGLYLLVELTLDKGLEFHDLDVVLDRVNDSVAIQVIFRGIQLANM